MTNADRPGAGTTSTLDPATRRDPGPSGGGTRGVVAITGGARGFGRATADRLLDEGWQVAIGDLDGDAAKLTADALGRGCAAFQLDVTDPDAFAAFLDSAEAALGPVDVLVNNAGIMLVGDLLDESNERARRMVDVNLHGVIHGMKAVLPRMLSRRRGHIVNVSSAAGKLALPGQATYAATKHAVVGLSEAASAELRGSGIEVSVVMPGLANTELAAGMRTGIGTGRVQPEQVAAAIARTLRRPRFGVYLPAYLGPALALFELLPRPALAAVNRLLRNDRISTRIDWTVRNRYEDRAAR